MKKFTLLLSFLSCLSVFASNSEPVPVRSLAVISAEEDIQKMEALLNDVNFTATNTNAAIEALLHKDIFPDLLPEASQKKLKNYINNQLIIAVQNLDIKKVEHYLKLQADPNYAFENNNKYNDFIFPLKVSLNLKTKNPIDEENRKTIIAKLLQSGANPFLTPHPGTAPSNLFLLENVLENPELAKFFAQTAKVYTKTTDKTQFLHKYRDAIDSYHRTPFHAGNFFIALDNIQDPSLFWTTKLFNIVDFSRQYDKETTAKAASFFILMGARPDDYRTNIFFHLTGDENNAPLLKVILESEPFSTNSDKKIELLNQIENQETPLSKALIYKNPEIIELLLKHGANPNINLEDDLAARAVSNPAIFRLLLKYGAHPGKALAYLLAEYNELYPTDFINDLFNKYTFDQKDLDNALTEATQHKGTKFLTDEKFNKFSDALLYHGADPKNISVHNVCTRRPHPKWQQTKDELITKHQIIQKRKRSQTEALNANDSLMSRFAPGRIPAPLKEKIAQMTLEGW